ncbi:MAG: ABC transporter permease subunit [Raoultibacter sp.]
MNVYRFEFKHQALSIIWQTALLAGLLAILMVAVFPVYADAETQVRTVLEGFPPEFAAMFGIAIDSIFSYGGFYTFGFLYLSLVGAIMASSLGLAVFSREKRSQCLDFLLAKPISRTRIFATKLLVCLTGLAVVNVVFVVTAWVVHAVSSDTALSTTQVVLMALALAGTQLVFLALSIAVATFLRRIRSVSGVATAIGFAGFLLTMLPELVDEKLRFISPLQYFSPSDVIATGSFDGTYGALACGVIAVALIASFVRYRFADVSA